MTSKEITTSEPDMTLTRQESMITNIFGKDLSIIRREKLRGRTKIFDIKLKIFCALHKPIHWAKLYHLIVLIVIFFSVIALNIIDEELATDGHIFNTSITYIKVLTDSIIIIILSIELVLRLWTCGVISEFRGFRGGLKYLKTYAFWRALDVFGIIVFLAYILNHVYIRDYEMDSNIRICHLTQVFQMHRLMYRFLKVIIETIKSQMFQLIIVFIFAFLALILTAFCVYLTEREFNPNINRFFDAFWMTFITFSTIGYGDIAPVTSFGRILVMVCASFGFVFFALPGSILGTGLALKVQEDQKRTAYYRTPAARLIQSVWRSYASNQMSKSDAHWKIYKRKDGQPLTPQDRACIRFIRSVAYLKQRHRFKVIIGLVNDDFFRERSTRELSRRLQQTENNLKSLMNDINKILNKRDKTKELLNKLEEKINQLKERNKNQ